MLIHQGDANSLSTHRQVREQQSPETQQLLAEDARYFLHQALSTPVLNALSRTEGAYIYDLDGRKYLDLHGNGVHNVGFNNPFVVEAVKRQLDESLAFTPRRYTNVPAVEFAKKLCQSSPAGLERVLFCPGGSEAIEMAIILAKQITGRYKTISYWDCYHGTTYQAATVGGDEHFTGGIGPMVPGAFHVEFPNYYRNPWGLTDTNQIDDLYVRQIENILQRNPDIACIVGTPIASAPHVPTAYYWQRVADLCQKHDAFLIFDEIVCGLGRSGKLFACEHYVTPDVVVMGKSLGGGIVPFAGILTKEEHNRLQHRSIGHFTHEKSPVGSAAGLAVLEYMEREDTVNKVAELGLYFQDRLRELQDQYPIIGNIEGKGFLIGIDLVKDRRTKERAAEAAQRILAHSLQRGLSYKLYEGNMITMRPSLVIGKEEIDFIVETLRAGFAALKPH
jgi:4-aminobutyrate aminotransferase